MRYLTRAVLLIVALMFAGAALAQPRPGAGGTPTGGAGGGAPAAAGGLISQFNAEQFAALFTSVGFNSEVFDNKVDNQSTHMVRIQFWPNDNSTFAGAIPIWCKKDNPKICNAMDIFVNLGKASVDEKWINAWNDRIYFARAYLLDNGSLIFSFQFLLQPGVSADYIKTALVAFKSAVDLSTDFRP